MQACVQNLATPDTTYRQLGAKMVVGMPFKDIATSDTLFLPSVPPASDKAGRKALKRLQVCTHKLQTGLSLWPDCPQLSGSCACDVEHCLHLIPDPQGRQESAPEGTCCAQEVGVHVLAGAATLSEEPLPHAVAVLSLAEAVRAGGQPPLPEGSQRFVVTIDGTESDAELSQLQVSCW